MKFRPFLFLVMALAFGVGPARTQTWIPSPSSGDWDTASNWDTTSVPNSASATATFGTSSATLVTLGSDVTLDGIRFLAGASGYTLGTGSSELLLVGAGLTNLSSNTQLLSNTGGLFFYNASTAAGVSIHNLGSLTFLDFSTAASANIANDANLSFLDSSTAAGATIVNNSYLAFDETSTAANASLTNTVFLGLYGSATLGSAFVSNSFNFYLDGSSTAASASVTNMGMMVFTGSSNAGTANLGNSNGLYFDTNASAASATIHNTQELAFSDSSTAGSAVITNDFIMDFYEDSTAGTASIVNNQTLSFNNDATAGSAVLTNNASLYFNSNATAGSAVLTTSAAVNFNGDSTAGSALVTVGTGGTVHFYDDSQGGTARFVLSGGSVSTESADGPVTVGSLEGNGTVYLGPNGTATGANNLSTTLVGTLDDGPSTGSFFKLGSGILTLSGSNTYDGDTTIEGGELRIVGTGTLGAGNIITGGVLDLSGHTGAVSVGGLSGIGNVLLGGNDLTLGGSSGGGYLSGSILDGGFAGGSGGGLNKNGVDALILVAANTYSGGTSLNAGSIYVGDTSSLGTGSVVNGGTLAVFLGPRTIAIGGDYTQTPSGTLAVRVGGLSGGQSDLWTVTGTAVLAGDLNLGSYLSFIPAVGDAVTILTASGGVGGRFDSWVDPIGARWYPLYGGNEVMVLALHPSFEALGLTDNQTAVGAWLDAAYQDPVLETFMVTQGAQSAVVLRPQFESLAPEELAQTFAAGFSLARDHAGILTGRLGRWENGEEGLGTFLEGGISSEKADGGTAPGWDRTSHGMLGGVDLGLGQDGILGVLLGYGRSETSLQGGGSVLSSGASGGFFGAWKKEGFRLSGLLEGGLLDHETSRSGDGGMASAKARGPWFSGSVRVGYELGWDGSHILPYVQGQGALVQLDGFSETGSQLPLSFASQSQQSLFTRAGVQASRPWKMGGLACSVFLDLSWEHLFEGDRPGVSAGLSGDPTVFTTRGPVTGTDGLALSSTLNVGFMEGLAAYFRYQGRLAFQALDSQSFAGGVSVGF